MIEIRILIEGEYRDIDLFDDEDIRMDLSIAEIQDITKKNSAFTKDFNIPGSKGNNEIFQNFYDPNSVQFSYDVRSKFPAIILYQGYIIFEGYLRLNRAVKTVTEIFYNVSFYTQVGDLVANISDKYMRQLDLSYLDFQFDLFPLLNWSDPDVYDPNSVLGSGVTFWSLANKGYTYQSTTGGTETNSVNFAATPLIEFDDFIGYSGNNYSNTTNATMTNPYNGVKWWYFTPNLQVRELYSQILEQNGYILESNFMDTAYFKRYYLPLNYSENLFPLQAITPQYIVQQSGLLSASAYTPNFCVSELCPSTFTGGGDHRAINPNPVITDNFGASTGNGYSILLSIPGFYEFKVSYTATNTGATDNNLIMYCFRLEDNALSTSGWSMAGFTQLVPTGTTAQTFTNYFSFNSAQEARTLTNFFAFDFASQFPYDASRFVENLRIELVASPLTPRYLNGLFKYNLEFPANEFKQIDFIQSINKMFNLVVVPQLDDKRILKVEPIIDYFGSGPVLDWTQKVDRNKPIQILPTTTIIDGTLFFNYEDEKDLGHETFLKTNAREFGAVNVSLSTDYKDRITEIKPIFASQIDYVIPINTDAFTITSPIYYLTIQKDIDGTSTNFFNPYRKNPQLMYRGINLPSLMFGEYECPNAALSPGGICTPGFGQTAWWYVSNTGSTVWVQPEVRYSWQENNRFTTYPWGVSGFSHYTNFNKRDRFDSLEQDFSCYEDMYDVYYREYIEDLTSANSRVLTCSVFLNPFEIKALNFSEKIFIDGNYYRLNKIKDYSLLKLDVVEVELVKITKEYTPHRVRYYDLINCSEGANLHTSTDLNATMFAYVGKYMKLTDGICYLVQNGTYNSTYTYERVRSAIPTDFRARVTPTYDTCVECEAANFAPNPWDDEGFVIYDEINCNVFEPVVYPPSPTPSATLTPTPSITPSATPGPCYCVEVSIFNDSEVESPVVYTDCNGEVQVEFVPAFGFFVDCMCNNTWQIDGRMTATVLRTCPGYTPQPTATPTRTPSPTPSSFSCDCREYSLAANFDGPASADYINCSGVAQSILVPRGDEATFCACNGTVEYVEGTLIDLGPCAPPSPSPTNTVTPTNTKTPTPTPSATPPSFDPDAATYLSQVLFAGGTGITMSVSAATNTLFTTLKNDGLYSKLAVMYPFLGGVANSTAINAKNPSTFFMQWNGGMTHSASGVTGNGTNGYGNTLYGGTAFTVNDISMTIYQNSANVPAKTEEILCGLYSAQPSFQIGTNFTSGSPDGWYYRVGRAGVAVRGAYSGMTGDTYTITRDGSTTELLYKGGTLLSTNAASTYTNSPGFNPIYAFNFNLSNAPYSNGYANQRLGFFCFGSGLDATEALNLHNAIIAFNTALGRAL